jgi:GTP-binding protein HflX
VRRLLFGNKGAVALSATERDSTRRLVERIAEALQDRWTRSAHLPACVTSEEEDISSGERSREAMSELTTLEELVGARKGRRAVARA